MNKQRLLDRFLRYVQIDTTARSEAGRYPSSIGQLDLGAMVLDELRAMKLADACQDDNGIVTATIPSTVGRTVPQIAWFAHFDTSPETSGTAVKPQVIENYRGGDIVLPGDSHRMIRPAEHPDWTPCMAARSSPRMARRCSGPTTKRAWP